MPVAVVVSHRRHRTRARSRIIVAVFGGHLRKHGRFGEWEEIVKLYESLPDPE